MQSPKEIYGSKFCEQYTRLTELAILIFSKSEKAAVQHQQIVRKPQHELMIDKFEIHGNLAGKTRINEVRFEVSILSNYSILRTEINEKLNLYMKSRILLHKETRGYH